MESPYLKAILDLICTYTELTSHSAIAKQLNISEATLRGYWAEDKYAGQIPDKNVEKFCQLLIDVLPNPTSLDAAKRLLLGNPIVFHNALLPIAGKSWHELMQSPQPLETNVEPLGLGFGMDEILDDIGDVPEADIGQGFYFTANSAWRGEGFVCAEHGGVWHMIAYQKNQRVFPIESGQILFPPLLGDKRSCLVERAEPGYYRYWVVLVHGKMPTPLREQLHHANPYVQTSLDILADTIQALGDEFYAIFGTTIRIR